MLMVVLCQEVGGLTHKKPNNIFSDLCKNKLGGVRQKIVHALS